jgi:beta-glucosidase
LQDSPVGVRDTDYNSVFSSGQTVAATFDRGLMYARGYAMGEEHKGKSVTVQLGPVAGPIGRAPEGGRNWEGFSPDPVLTGIGMAETITGIQNHVIACAKHFIGNEQEHFRQVEEASLYGTRILESYSSNIDDVTMHELYLWPFADAVRAGVGSIMCSYNQVNNSYACQNSKVLNNLLKGELGFQGFVMSDWQAQHTGVASALAGLDMTMPGDTTLSSGISYWGPNLTLAVINGTIPEWRIDDMATRVMAAFFKVGFTINQPPINFDSWTLNTFGPLYATANSGFQQINFHVDVRSDHASLIRNIGARGTVLLKNLNNALPLKKPKFVAVIGEDAGPNPDGPNSCGDRGCDSGTLGMAWGSGSANFPYLITPDAALQNQAVADGSRYESVLDNFAMLSVLSLASQADATSIVFVNADSGEGYISVGGNIGDRNNLTLWNGGDDLIKNVSSVCNNTIVVIHSTGPTIVTDWYNSPNVTAILWAGVPGQESGNSITDVLYGKINPAARTPFTWGPTRESYGTDVLYTANNGINAPQIDFTEGVFIDYRAFDKQNITPIFEFGFGLSYSNLQVKKTAAGTYTPMTGMTQPAPVLGNFSTNLADYQFPSSSFPFINRYIYPYLNSTDAKTASKDPSYGETADKFLPPHATDGSAQPLLPAGGAPGGNPELYDVLYEVTATIENNGTVNGEEVPQLYISLGGPNDPKVVLRNFERLSIDAGKSATFTADITRRDLSNWDTVSQNWVISKYPKTVYVGSSSRKLLLSQVLT